MSTTMNRLDDKVVFVTGAAGGQGVEHARLLSTLGATVVLADLDEAAVQAVASSIPGPTLAVGFDVQDATGWATAVDRTIAAFGRLDVLVNNAAWRGPKQSLADLDETTLVTTLAINLVGPILGMKAVAPVMRENGGSIINIASTAGVRSYPTGISYGASKWGLRGATKTAAVELGASSIRVNCICPGVINTPMANPESRTGDPTILAQPIGRMGEPHEVSGMVAYLASDASSFCTGQDFIIDGGRTI